MLKKFVTLVFDKSDLLENTLNVTSTFRSRIQKVRRRKNFIVEFSDVGAQPRACVKWWMEIIFMYKKTDVQVNRMSYVTKKMIEI